MKAEKIQSSSNSEVMSNFVFTELVMCIEEMRSSEDETPIFTLSELAQLICHVWSSLESV